MKTFKQFLLEILIKPTTISNTMSLWHGGNLSDDFEAIAHKKGRYEFGPGLYCTTHYETARKYAKGSRKFYMITIQKGNDAKTTKIDYNKSIDFVNNYVLKAKRNEILSQLFYHKNNLLAYIFINILINYEGIKPSNTIQLRKFLINQNIDYMSVDNAFGWHEMMIIIYNMRIIIDKKIISPNDKISTYDLPINFLGNENEKI